MNKKEAKNVLSNKMFNKDYKDLLPSEAKIIDDKINEYIERRFEQRMEKLGNEFIEKIISLSSKNKKYQCKGCNFSCSLTTPNGTTFSIRNTCFDANSIIDERITKVAKWRLIE